MFFRWPHIYEANFTWFQGHSQYLNQRNADVKSVEKRITAFKKTSRILHVYAIILSKTRHCLVHVLIILNLIGSITKRKSMVCKKFSRSYYVPSLTMIKKLVLTAVYQSELKENGWLLFGSNFCLSKMTKWVQISWSFSRFNACYFGHLFFRLPS